MADDDFTLPRLLLCEGPEDVAFFDALIEVRSLPRFHVRHTGGRRNDKAGNTLFASALRRVTLNRKYARLEHILVVSDNDVEPQVSLDFILKQIGDAGFPVPTAPLITTAGRPKITVMMIPLGGLPGNLETASLQAAENADRIMAAKVNQFAATIQADKWSVSRRGKMWLRSSLAARCDRDPFVFLGSVFRDPRYRHLIPLDDASFTPIAEVLTNLGS